MQGDSLWFAPDAAGGKGDDQDADEAAHHWQVPEVARCRFRDNRQPAHAGEDTKGPWSIPGVIEEEGKEMNYLFTSKMIDQTYFWGDEEKHFIRSAINMLHT